MSKLSVNFFGGNWFKPQIRRRKWPRRLAGRQGDRILRSLKMVRGHEIKNDKLVGKLKYHVVRREKKPTPPYLP